MRLNRWLWKRKLLRIEKRLAVIESQMASEQRRDADTFGSSRRTFEAQELASEFAELRRLQRDTQAKLNAQHHRPSPEQKQQARRRKKVLDAMERERTANAVRFIATLERQGDFRNARLHRVHLLGLRERIENEFA